MHPTQALAMASALYASRHPFRLVFFEGGDHSLSEYREEVDSLVKVWLDRYVRDRQLMYAKGHGVRSVERREPVTLDILFQIGSVTKVFTSTLLVQLRDQSRIALDIPVDQYLPEDLETPWRARDELARPMLRQLATHRAGLPRNLPNRRDRPGSPSVMEPYSVAELYQGAGHNELHVLPRDLCAVFQLRVCRAGSRVGGATGGPYEELLHEDLLRPLEMWDTKIRLTAGDLERFAAH